jgi:hypothetical protein
LTTRTGHGKTVHGVGRRPETAPQQHRNSREATRIRRSPTILARSADALSSSIVSHF